jgi:hypothetical protein
VLADARKVEAADAASRDQIAGERVRVTRGVGRPGFEPGTDGL